MGSGIADKIAKYKNDLYSGSLTPKLKTNTKNSIIADLNNLGEFKQIGTNVVNSKSSERFSLTSLNNVDISFNNGHFEAIEVNKKTKDEVANSVSANDINFTEEMGVPPNKSLDDIAPYKNQQKDIISKFPDDMKADIQHLFNVRNSNLSKLSGTDRVLLAKAINEYQTEIKDFDKLLSTEFTPVKLMQLGGASEQEINNAKAQFTNRRDNTLKKIIEVKCNIANGNLQQNGLSIKFNGEIGTTVLGKNDTFVAINQQTGKFYSYGKDNDTQPAFNNEYASKYCYMLKGNIENTQTLQTAIEETTTKNLLNGIKLSKNDLVTYATKTK